MKVLRFLPCLLILFGVACSQEDKLDTDPSLQTRAVTLISDIDDVEVLIFKHEESEFSYLNKVNSGWSSGKTTVYLKAGDYKFFYYKATGGDMEMTPAAMDDVSSFDDFQWNAVADTPSGDDYFLPVGELWLAQTATMANEIQTVSAATTVSQTLTRAVSQVVVHLRKGVPGEAGELPTDGESVTLGTLNLDIAGVGEAVTINGSTGTGKTKVSLTQGKTNLEEYATFEGPIVFPSESGEATVQIAFTPDTSIDFPEINTTVTGPLERNRKLEITLWINEEEPREDEFLTISVTTSPMTDSEDGGDSGIWN